MELSRPLSTVSPTLDGDVLAVLARSDAAFTTGQLRRVLSKASAEGIRKVLQRLTRQGVVHSTTVGNAYSYRLNRDHLAAEHITALAQLQEELLKRITGRLSSWPTPPVYAAVFGSAADGSSTADSDLDLLLVYPADADHDQWQDQVDELVDDVTRWTGNDTRPTEFADTEIAGRSHDPVLADTAAGGLTVAGSREWLVGQLRSRKA